MGDFMNQHTIQLAEQPPNGYTKQVWALSFASSVYGTRHDIDFTEIYNLGYRYADKLSAILTVDPKEAAKDYLNNCAH
jgi:hypothetical protein